MQRLTIRSRIRRCDGFTYLGILFAVALLGASLSVVGTMWSTASKRTNELELLFIGHEFRDAIASYYSSSQVGVFQYPRMLSDLLADRRGPTVVRHLRRLYADPFTKSADWELITLPDGAIIGIASSSTGTPLKRAGFATEDAGFEGAECYCDWRFIYLPQLAASDAGSL